MEAILNKIKKLKALSESAAKINSIAESEAAILAMNKLLTKYNLSLLDLGDTEDNNPSVEIEYSPMISVQNPYGRQWKERLLMTLCMYNYCKLIASGHKVFLLGTYVNTTTVIDLFNSIQSVYLHNAKELYNNARKDFRGGRLTEKYKRQYITSYLLGCSIGLSVKLNDAKSQECTAVAIRHDELIQEYIDKNLKVKSKPLKETKVNDSAYIKGFYDGRKTPLQKTINQ